MSKVKRKTQSQHLSDARAAKGKDFSPTWDGCDEWDTRTFSLNFHWAMKYYNIEKSAKDLKPAVLKWMGLNGFTTDDIDIYKKGAEWRSNTSVGGIASCLLKGMPSQRDDFNQGADTAAWLRNRILEIIDDCKKDITEETEEVKPTSTVNIQERLKDISLSMTVELEEAIESWITDPDAFNHKAFNIHHYLKGKSAKSSHVRIIKDYYTPMLSEFEQLAGPSPAKPAGYNESNTDEDSIIEDPYLREKDMHDQLKEGYKQRSKKNITSMLNFLKDIMSACDMIIQEDKANRVPRVKKSIPKEKLVEKLNYLKTDDNSKTVSINPVTIIGSSLLWCYDSKTKKLFRYIADEFDGPLGIKGTTITGYDPIKSIGKTVKKPAEQLAIFKAGSKTAINKFFDGLTTVEIKANGRINPNQILLKVH